jgi:hypothetical protein
VSIDPELLALRLRKAQLLQKRVEYARSNGLAFYHPHPKQDEFHRAFRYKKRMFKAGNRTGKSHMGCAENVAWCLGERLWYPQNDPARRGGIPQHPNKLITITNDWDVVQKVWTSQLGEGGKVWKYAPADAIKSTHKNSQGVIDTIEFHNKSLWHFETVCSFKTNPKGVESADWDAIHIDEPCPKDMYTAAARGLIDRGGACWFTLTPIGEFWINDLFFPQDTGGQARDDVWAITGSTYDNPYLSRAAIAEFERDLSEEERQCRIYGIPLHLSGLIYKEFQWNTHVLKDLPKDWESYTNPPLSWPIYVFIDPHPRTPHAVLFCTVDPFGRRYYYNDVFVHCAIKELVQEHILPVVGNHRIVWTKMDPLGFIKDPNTEECWADLALDAGLFCEKATKALSAGIDLTKGNLKFRDPSQQPTMFFAPTCRRTLWEIQRYSWSLSKPDSPIDEDDHMMENLYRAELSQPRWVDFKSSASRSVIEPDIIDEPLLDLPEYPEVVSFAR